jgi:hypothetical protein
VYCYQLLRIRRCGIQQTVFFLSEAREKLELGLEEIYVTLFIGNQFLEQVLADIVAFLLADIA